MRTKVDPVQRVVAAARNVFEKENEKRTALLAYRARFAQAKVDAGYTGMLVNNSPKHNEIVEECFSEYCELASKARSLSGARQRLRRAVEALNKEN